MVMILVFWGDKNTWNTSISVSNTFVIQSNQSIKCIYKALLTSADVTKCYTETQPKTPNSKQCRCRTISLKRQESRKKPREEPGSELIASPLLVVQGGDYNSTWPRCSNFMDDQQGQIIIPFDFHATSLFGLEPRTQACYCMSSSPWSRAAFELKSLEV
jgi:hypothetical protein